MTITKKVKNTITSDIEKLDRRIADWLKKTNTLPTTNDNNTPEGKDVLGGILDPSKELIAPPPKKKEGDSEGK